MTPTPRKRGSAQAEALAAIMPEIMSMTYRLTHGMNCPEQLTISQFKILQVVWSMGRPIRMTELSKALGVAQSTVTDTVKKLSSMGLLKRERSSEDDRVVELSLTKPSIALLEKHQQGLIEFFDRVFATLTAKEGKNFLESHEVIRDTYRLMLAKEEGESS